MLLPQASDSPSSLFEIVGLCLAVGDPSGNVENRFFVKLSAGHGSTFVWGR
jgi:hypothetical protein